MVEYIIIVFIYGAVVALGIVVANIADTASFYKERTKILALKIDEMERTIAKTHNDIQNRLTDFRNELNKR